jgi:hypothetical protein
MHATHPSTHTPNRITNQVAHSAALFISIYTTAQYSKTQKPTKIVTVYVIFVICETQLKINFIRYGQGFLIVTFERHVEL